MITEPGVYDYEGTVHIWKGEGGCDFLSKNNVAIMEIQADNVVVKNFGFKGAIYGIRISDFGEVRKNVTLENVEGDACFAGLSLPKNYSNLRLHDVSVVTWRP